MITTIINGSVLSLALFCLSITPYVNGTPIMLRNTSSSRQHPLHNATHTPDLYHPLHHIPVNDAAKRYRKSRRMVDDLIPTIEHLISQWVSTFHSVLANSPNRTDSFGDMVTAHPDLKGSGTAGVDRVVDGVMVETIIVTARNFTTPRKDISGNDVPIDDPDLTLWADQYDTYSGEYEAYSGEDGQYNKIDAWPV
jgi:hypothetical protein